MIKLIVAVDRNWAIGNNNKLLVSIPKDMKSFREMTTGKVIILEEIELFILNNCVIMLNKKNIMT